MPIRSNIIQQSCTSYCLYNNVSISFI